MTWEDILKNRRRKITLPERQSKKEMARKFTTAAINPERVNRQENKKRLETLMRWVDDDREHLPDMKLKLEGFKKTFEELEEEEKETFEDWAKDDDSYKDSNLTGKELYEMEKKNYMGAFDNFIKHHEKQLSEIKELERKFR